MNYNAIKEICTKNSAISRQVIDEFLLYYAAAKENLEPRMEVFLKKYKSAARELQESYINFLKAEYIAHRIFKKDGYITGYLHHAQVKRLNPEHYQYLEFQAQNPWRYSFAEIINKPADSFFEMEDVFTGEQYLLYSPGMKATEEESPQKMWFNLIAFNGQCHQTFGLIIPFKSFTSDDLFFFATELNPEIESDEMLMAEVENNPFPFFMLLSASTTPTIVSRGFESLMCFADDFVENFKAESLSDKFTIEWNKNVYQLTSKAMGSFPHFAIAYYDEKFMELVRTASTIEGFESLTEILLNAGFEISRDADIVISLAMYAATQKVLNKKLELNPYIKFFDLPDTGNKKPIDDLNFFLQLAMPYINSKQEPDLKVLAEKAGMDVETARSLWEQTKKNVEEMWRKYGG